jgi:hypothetical protein
MGVTAPTREQILALLGRVSIPLDDDDIGDRLGINRHYVNQVCRRLASEGVVRREEGPVGKILNVLAVDTAGTPPPISKRVAAPAPSTRMNTRRQDRARRNVEELITGFAGYVERFERSNAFAGPSLYFHERAIAWRQRHATVAELMADERFFEYVYAVLPAWGMHRMGNQSAKVGEFAVMVDSFRSAAPRIEALWDRRITEIPDIDADAITEGVWDVIASLKVSTSRTRIVAGSKALHHVLPGLVPPIDRQYTFRFFTGQKLVTAGEQRAFLEWFPHFCAIGRQCRPEIEDAIRRGGFMATGPAKVIDNAIMGFMQGT